MNNAWLTFRLTLTMFAITLFGLPAQAQDALIESVCLVTDIGRVDDGTFNQGGYEGMLAAAQASPDVYFIGVDHFYSEAPANLVGLQFREDQAGFLAGALAGLLSDSDVGAGVYGIDVPPVARFRCGFENGVKHSNEGAQALGVHVPSFIDPATGAETALQFIVEGADVILGAGGATGSGAIRAAAAQGVYVIGVDQDEYLTTFGRGESPGAEFLLGSALKRVDQAVYLSLQALVEGDAATFHGEGGVRLLDAASEGIGLGAGT